MNHKFTIVTVCFNAGDLLERTIQSVSRQKYHDIEYIIIDGASTDNTNEIINKYKKYINYWICEPDKGIYEAMNKGIEKASGDWINFMNAGDVFADDEVLLNLSQEVNNKNAVVYGDRYYLDNGKRTLQKANSIETIFKRMPFGHQAAFFRGDIIKKKKFNETYKFTADYDLLMQLYLEKFSFQYIDIPICIFSSGGKSESGLRPYLEALKILFDYCDDEKIIEQNAYFQAFYKSSKKLLQKSIGK